MAEAFFWGLVSASSLLIGGLLALRFSFGRRSVGLVMAFGAGVLIAAVAYELFLVAVEEYHAGGAAVGLFAGAIVFYVGDTVIGKYGGQHRKSMRDHEEESEPLPMVLGVLLDGVPESLVLGMTLLEGGVALTVLVAVLLSDLPEALGASTGLLREGWSGRKLTGMWLVIVLGLGLTSAAGYGIFANASDQTVAFVLAFAGGAILTMLADTMMPEAFEDSGPLVGLVTTFGFALAFAIQSLE